MSTLPCARVLERSGRVLGGFYLQTQQMNHLYWKAEKGLTFPVELMRGVPGNTMSPFISCVYGSPLLQAPLLLSAPLGLCGASHAHIHTSFWMQRKQWTWVKCELFGAVCATCRQSAFALGRFQVRRDVIRFGDASLDCASLSERNHQWLLTFLLLAGRLFRCVLRHSKTPLFWGMFLVMWSRCCEAFVIVSKDPVCTRWHEKVHHLFQPLQMFCVNLMKWSHIPSNLKLKVKLQKTRKRRKEIPLKSDSPSPSSKQHSHRQSLGLRLPACTPKIDKLIFWSLKTKCFKMIFPH